MAVAFVLGRTALSVETREPSQSRGQYNGSSWTDHCCHRLCKPLYFARHETSGASIKHAFRSLPKSVFSGGYYKGGSEAKMMKQKQH